MSIVDRGYPHHALDTEVVEPNEEPVRQHPRDYARVFLTEVLGHVGRLLDPDRLALGALRHPLRVGTVFADVVESRIDSLRKCHRVFPALELAEQAVHQQVGVAADRRGEMGVVLEGETEVPDVLHKITSNN